MGDVDQVIAEPDELEEEEEGVDGLHPHHLHHQDPRIITLIYHMVLSFVVANGWFVVCLLLLSYLAWVNFGPHFKRWLSKREDEREAAVYKKDPDALIAKHQAIDEARQRMQERYNAAAAVSLQKKAEMEEKMRESKLAEFEAKQLDGHRLSAPARSSAASVSASSSSSSSSGGAKGKSGAKPRLRPEYNHLAGDTGASDSCRWRPSGRGSSGGG